MFMNLKCKECGAVELFEECSNPQLFAKYQKQFQELHHTPNMVYRMVPASHCMHCAADDYVDSLAKTVIGD
jgi:hypothetical protein